MTRATLPSPSLRSILSPTTPLSLYRSPIIPLSLWERVRVRAKGKRQKLRAKDKGEGNDQSNSPLTLAALHPLPYNSPLPLGEG